MALTVLVAVLTLANAYMEVYVTLVVSTTGFVILFVLINSTIIFAVFHIRATIKRLKGGKIKNTLMLIHCFNFFLFTGTYITNSVLLIAAINVHGDFDENHDEDTHLKSRELFYADYLTGFIYEFVLLYNVLFLLALIVMFAKN